MSWVFLSGTFTNQKDLPPVSFQTTTLTLRGFDRQAWGGFKSTFLVVSDVSGERPMNGRLSMMMEVMRPLVPFDPWRSPRYTCCCRWTSAWFFFSPKKNTSWCLFDVWKTEMKLGIWERNDDVVEKGTCICTAEDHGGLILAATSPQFCGCLHSYWSCSWSIILIGNMPSQLEQSGETHIFIPPEVQHSQWEGTIPHKENTHPTRHFSAIR